MPPEANPELHHPDAAGWALGILDPPEAASFEAHLADCEECQSAVAEFQPVADALHGPVAPAVEPPADLEVKTLASVQDAVVAARNAEEKAPGLAPRKMSAWWHWHWNLPVFSVAAACGAAAAAIVVIAAQQLGHTAPAQAVAKFSLHTVSGNAAGTVIAHESPNGYTLDAALKNLPPLKGNEYYECWYLRSPQGPPSDAITGGSFTAATSNRTFTMTSAADPSRYKIMEIAIQHAGDSDRPGTVILRGTAQKVQRGQANKSH